MSVIYTNRVKVYLLNLYRELRYPIRSFYYEYLYVSRYENKWYWLESRYLKQIYLYRWIRYTPIICYYRLKLKLRNIIDPPRKLVWKGTFDKSSWQ